MTHPEARNDPTRAKNAQVDQPMIERIKDAICRQIPCDDGFICQACTNSALAALTALETPTQAMIEAIMSKLAKGSTFSARLEDNIRFILAAAIAAAKEGM